jgi:hypothetical protein
MTPGIPGAGIGGLFYVCSSLVLSLRHAWRRARRQQSNTRSRDVALLALQAVGIALGVWIAGWLVGALVAPELRGLSRATSLVNGNAHVRNAIRVAAIVIGVATLGMVMLGVELARLWQQAKLARSRR